MAKETKKTAEKANSEKQVDDSIPKEQVFTAPWEPVKPRPFNLEEFDKAAKSLIASRLAFEHEIAPLCNYHFKSEESPKITLDIVKKISDTNQSSYATSRISGLFSHRSLSEANALYVKNKPQEVAGEIYQMVSESKKIRALCKKLDSGHAETVLLDDVTEMLTTHILADNTFLYSNPTINAVEGQSELYKLIRAVGEVVNHFHTTKAYNPSKYNDPAHLTAAGEFTKQPFQIIDRLTSQISLIRQAITEHNNNVRWNNVRDDGYMPFLSKYSEGKEIPTLDLDHNDYSVIQTINSKAAVRAQCSNLRNLVARDISAGKLVFSAALDLMLDIHLGSVHIINGLIEEHRALVSCIDYLGAEVAELLKHTLVETVRREASYRITTVDGNDFPF